MKLLKQNGSNGKIIRGQVSGKALKQNYNFGNALSFQGKYFVDVPSLVGRDMTAKDIGVMYTNTNNSSYSGDFTIYQDSSTNNAITGNRRNPGSGVYSYKGTSKTNALNIIGAANFTGFNLSSSGVANSLIETRTISIQRPESLVINGLWIGRGSGLYHTDKICSSSKMNSFLLFERLLLKSEFIYWRNNLLGNDPLNTNSLLIYLKMNTPEIFDFGGTIGQAIGIRDYSGLNHHGRIRGLPAGTVQEQLDFANNNLFSKW